MTKVGRGNGPGRTGRELAAPSGTADSVQKLALGLAGTPVTAIGPAKPGLVGNGLHALRDSRNAAGTGSHLNGHRGRPWPAKPIVESRPIGEPLWDAASRFGPLRDRWLLADFSKREEFKGLPSSVRAAKFWRNDCF
jgi:hypothetical protein